jgi:hypothetical protein
VVAVRALSVSFICGTDSPVSMASLTTQEPRTNRASQGTMFAASSTALRLPLAPTHSNEGRYYSTALANKEQHRESGVATKHTSISNSYV